MSANVGAFLSMVSHSEGSDRAADPYRVCFGFKHTIASLADHPLITGEWRGEPLDFLGPKYAGMVSTAAGRYQLIKPTWVSLKGRLRLADFSAASQDTAAIELLREAGALAMIEQGHVAAAITQCRNIWASLPGGNSGQPQRTLAQLIEVYSDAGGAFA